MICSCEVREKTYDILSDYRDKHGVLVQALQDVQKEFGYLPGDALMVISEELGLSLANICGVASFYTNFYFIPRGENIIKVCVGTACHVRGAEKILESVEKKLNIKDGETTDDQKFTLETVSCLGCCALAPVVMVNEKVSKERKLTRLLKSLSEESDDGG